MRIGKFYFRAKRYERLKLKPQSNYKSECSLDTLDVMKVHQLQ